MEIDHQYEQGPLKNAKSNLVLAKAWDSPAVLPGNPGEIRQTPGEIRQTFGKVIWQTPSSKDFNCKLVCRKDSAN